MFEVVRAFIFILLFIAFQTLFSQTVKSGKWGLEVNYQLASILKHSPKIIRIPKELSHGIELNLFLKTYGEKNWHKALNFPETGISLNY